MSYETKNYILKLRRVTLFPIISNFFNVWLNSTELDSHMCFCVQSNAMF